MLLIRGALKAHRFTVWQTVVYDYQPPIDAPMVSRLALAVDRWIVVRRLCVDLILLCRRGSLHHDDKAEWIGKANRTKLLPPKLYAPGTPHFALPSIAAHTRTEDPQPRQLDGKGSNKRNAPKSAAPHLTALPFYLRLVLTRLPPRVYLLMPLQRFTFDVLDGSNEGLHIE